MENKGFLSRFRRQDMTTRETTRGSGGKADIRLRLDFGDEGATVTVVNPKGEQLSLLPDYRLYQGEMFNVLRVLDDIQQARLYSMDWDGSDLTFSLRNEPTLLFALLRCDRLVDSMMHPVTVSDEPAEIVLSIAEKDGECEPKLLVRCHKGDDTLARQASKQGQPLGEGFLLLSDVFALVGQTIHPIASLGTNYLRIGFFEEAFPKDMLEQYLSVFYSYVDNASLDYGDYTLVRSDQTIGTIPTLVIEKVDADMALYLRLTHTLAGVSADFVKDFDLTWQARLTMERQVVLHRIVNTDEQAEQEFLRKTIVSFSPDRKAAKEVWQSGGDFIVPQETAGPFLLQALPDLVRRYQLLGAEKLREYRVKAVKPKMKLSLSSGIDFLEGNATVSLDGEEFSLRKFLQQYRKQKYVTLSDGNRALVDEDYVKRLERIFRKAEKGGSDKVRVSFFDLPEVESLLQERLQGEAFEHHRKFYEGFNANWPRRK